MRRLELEFSARDPGEVRRGRFLPCRIGSHLWSIRRCRFLRYSSPHLENDVGLSGPRKAQAALVMGRSLRCRSAWPRETVGSATREEPDDTDLAPAAGRSEVPDPLSHLVRVESLVYGSPDAHEEIQPVGQPG